MNIAVLIAAALLGSSSTNEVITSEVRLSTGWHRRVVMKTENGDIVNDDNKVASIASTEAVNEAAERAGDISDAALESLQGAMNRLASASDNAATNAHMFALVIPPQTDVNAMLGYVVKTETSGSGVDTQYVWYSHDLAVAPNRFVVYQTYGNCTTNKVTWADWNTKTNVVVDGKTWSNCRVCTVQRPSWAVGKAAVDSPNEQWGGPNGMDWGDIAVMIDGTLSYTGVLTNKNNSADVIYFENGAYKGSPEE